MAKFILVKAVAHSRNKPENIEVNGYVRLDMVIVDNDEDIINTLLNDGYLMLEDYLSEHPNLSDTIVDYSLLPPLEDLSIDEN